MNLLCLLGLHRWKEERVLEQITSCGARVWLDEDVCQRCEKLRNPEDVANVYNVMSGFGGKVTMHPRKRSDAASERTQEPK